MDYVDCASCCYETKALPISCLRLARIFGQLPRLEQSHLSPLQHVKCITQYLAVATWVWQCHGSLSFPSPAVPNFSLSLRSLLCCCLLLSSPRLLRVLWSTASSFESLWYVLLHLVILHTVFLHTFACVCSLGFSQGKRKAKANVKTKVKRKVPKLFNCPHCSLPKTCEVSYNEGTHTIACRVCKASYSCPGKLLTDPIDVYVAWRDHIRQTALEAAAAEASGRASAGVEHQLGLLSDDDESDD